MKSEFAQRRQSLLNQIAPHSVVLVSSAPMATRNGSTHYPYRQRSDFYYLTGFEEPNAVLLLHHDSHNNPRFILFNQLDEPDTRLWTGPRAGLNGACMDYGADAAYPIQDLEDYLPTLLAECETAYFLLNDDLLVQEQLGVSSQSTAIKKWVDLAPLLHKMRAIKQPNEIEKLRTAASISAQAHCRAMQHCQPGQYEYQLEGELLHAFYQHGSRSPAYESIVATGQNACILHYQKNNTQLQTGELLLIDAGCEYDHYAADISRTFPVNGKFSPLQRELYTLVLDTQTATIAAVKPGTTWAQLETIAITQLTKGLLALGLLSGQLDTLIEEETVRQFYPHRIGHALGLDVHDITEATLKAGMVITIEPGLYIQPDQTNTDSKWKGIGIRIEDNILVTETGCEVLTSAAPKTVDEIEAVMRG